MMKFLIAGLGNIGREYESTRHNIGFDAVEIIAKNLKAEFNLERHAFVAKTRYAGKEIVLLKPTTYMNLSGKAVRYWLDNEKIPITNFLAILDDLALPFGKIRIRKKGGDGNHNGLTDIIASLGRNDFPRLRFGIGSDFARGYQTDYVLSKWSKEESEEIPFLLDRIDEIIKSFVKSGIDNTMNNYNQR